MGNEDTVKQLAAVDERTKIILKSMSGVHEKLDNLDCKKQEQRIQVLERESKDQKEKKLDTRLSSIEKLFWPSIIAGMTSFVGFVFFIIRSHL